MATVKIKLFGLLSIYGGPRTVSVQANTVGEALKIAGAMGVDKSLLKEALIFVNDRPVRNSRRTYKLNDGDEIALLSPSGGG